MIVPASSALRALLIASCMVVLLAGCSGSMMVRSNFSGAPPASSAPAAPAGPGQGLTAGVSGNLGLVIVLGLVLADVVHWTATKLKQSFGEKGNAPLLHDTE